MTIAKTVLNAQQNDSNLIMDYCDEHGVDFEDDYSNDLRIYKFTDGSELEECNGCFTVYFYKDGERIEDK